MLECRFSRNKLQNFNFDRPLRGVLDPAYRVNVGVVGKLVLDVGIVVVEHLSLTRLVEALRSKMYSTKLVFLRGWSSLSPNLWLKTTRC